MKKALSTVLVFVLCLSLCACGSNQNVAGAYWYASVFASRYPIILNEDSTYDSTNYGKGTYESSGKKIVLHEDNTSYDTATFVEFGDFYYQKSRPVSMENEYGQAVTFSEDGRINHDVKFTKSLGRSRYWICELSLRENGTFSLDEYAVEYPEIGKAEYRNRHLYEGSYSLENSILALTAEEGTFYLVYTKEGLYTEVYRKYDIKEHLIGRWQGEKGGSYEFQEDGTVVEHLPSGDVMYTYEIMNDGTIECVRSDGKHTIRFVSEFYRNRLSLLDETLTNGFAKE